MRDTLLLLNALLLAVGLILTLDPIAGRVGLLDRPGGRKTHGRVAPVTGGLAMFGAFLLPAVQSQASAADLWPLVAGLTVLVALGVADDLLNLRPWPKLAGQTVAALVLVAPGQRLIDAGALLGLDGLHAPALDAALTLLFIVGTINALNMLDGLDGLAGGAVAAALFWLAVAASLAGQGDTLLRVLLLLAAVLGFLVFNAPHPWRGERAVFMGDAGSMMLGAAIASFSLDLSASPASTAGEVCTNLGRLPFSALLWLVVVPVSDALIVFACRAASGQSPLRGDMRHVHHRLLQAGISRPGAAALLVAVCFVCGGVGVVSWWLSLPHGVLLPALLIPFMLHAFFVLHGWRSLAGARATPGGHEPEAAPEVAEALPRRRASFP